MENKATSGLNKAFELDIARECDIDNWGKMHGSFRSTFNSTLRVVEEGKYGKGGENGGKRQYLGVIDSDGEMHQVLTGLFVGLQEKNPDVVIYQVVNDKAVLNTEIVFIRDDQGHLSIAA